MEVVEYVFEKLDGSIRVLRGTQDFKKYAKKNAQRWDHIKPEGEAPANDNIIRVIDLDINEWRAIRKDSIISSRKVKNFKPQFTFSDNDGYYARRNKFNPNFIMKDKVPYHTLMVVSHNDDGLTRDQIEEYVDRILTQENKDFKVMDGRIRAITRATKMLKNNAFIKVDKGGYFKATGKGRKLLQTGVK